MDRLHNKWGCEQLVKLFYEREYGDSIVWTSTSGAPPAPRVYTHTPHTLASHKRALPGLPTAHCPLPTARARLLVGPHCSRSHLSPPPCARTALLRPLLRLRPTPSVAF